MLPTPRDVTPAPARRPAWRFVVETILFLSYAVFGLSWIGVAPLMAVLQAHFHVGSSAIALLNTTVAAAKMVTPIVTGFAAARIGLRRTLTVGALCIVAGGVLLPLSDRFALALVGRFIFGCGGAVVVTLLAPVVVQWFEGGERLVVNALNNVAVNTGIAITLFTTTPLAARFGWRGALFIYSGLSASLALAWILLGRERDAAAIPRTATSRAPAVASYRDVWRRRETWLVTLGFLAPLALYLAFNTWLPRYLVEARGVAQTTASHLMGLCNLVGIPAAIAGGVLSARLGHRRLFIIGAGLAIGGGALGLLYARTPTGLLASACVLGAALFVASSPLLTTAMELPGMTPAHVSLLMGTVLSGSYLVSSLSPVLVGWLRDRGTSLLPGLVVWAAFSFVLVPVGVLLPETGRRR